MQIHDIMNRLDEHWAENPFDDQILSKLLRLVPDDCCQRMDWRIELCAADLEYRWTQCRKMTDSALRRSDYQVAGRVLDIQEVALSTRDPSTNGFHAPVPRRPRAKDYEALLGEDWTSTECRRRMILAEWQIRCVAGDEPDIADFLLEFDGDARWQAELYEALSNLSAVKLQVTQNNEIMIEQFLPPRFVLGRQVRGEPAPPAWLPDAQKLVVIATDNTNLSRRQLEFRRCRTHEFEVTNASRNVSVELGRFKLKPGQAQRLPTPVSLEMPRLSIEISVRDV